MRVAGKPEPLLEIAAASPHELARLAWHIGNRHTDVQVIDERLRIRRDHVLEDMLRGLGARLTAIEAPFDPEPGAYGHESRSRSWPVNDRSESLRRSPSSEARAAASKGDGASAVDAPALYRLMAWLSPAYPIGAFSYSGGIEWAVEAGDIRDAATLRALARA